MVASSGREAVANANRYKTCTPGMCLAYTRTWLGIPAGNPDATAAWRNAKRKHVNGKDADAQHPPKGAPVFWSGGSAGHGHIALAINDDNGRSTDTPSRGVVGTRGGDWWRQTWGMPYLGWTEDLNGVEIPYLKGGGTDQWSSGKVYVEKLRKGQLDSDSVARLCYRLMRHTRIPKDKRPTHQARSYNKEITRAVKFWQQQVRPKSKGPRDGSSLSNEQANLLFGDRYEVIEK